MNWPAIIASLVRRGYSQLELARLCGCTQSTISDIATGKTKNPAFTTGDKLRELHQSRKPVQKA